ncbi:MAG: cytochrome c family protein [Hyphomonadaceae bacterium]|nr:cytochrome c family protein [Hyphomonadaceae bacterium]
MSDLRMNAVIGAVLASALGVMGLQELSGSVFATHLPETPGYAPEVIQEVAVAAPTEDAGPPDFGTLFADAANLTALIERGDRVHAQCTSCHTVDQGGPNRIGPNLWEIFGRAPGSHPGFEYSDAMKAYGGVWSYENLDAFLRSPAQAVRGTKMSFAGIRNTEDRVALIAYLRSLSASPAPLPAPLPAAAAPAETAATEAAPT